MWDPNKRGDARREFKVKGWAQRRKKSGSRERQCGIGLVLCWSFLATKASRSAKCFGSLGLVRLGPAQMRRCLDASLPAVRCPENAEMDMVVHRGVSR